MADERPEVDGRDPADAVAQMVAHVLRLAETWGAWDGHPLPADDRVYTPHKAIRRVADHMIDHLAQLEAHVAGAEPLPDRWHGSYMATPAGPGAVHGGGLGRGEEPARAARPAVAARARDDPTGGARPGGGRRLHATRDGVLRGLDVLRKRRWRTQKRPTQFVIAEHEDRADRAHPGSSVKAGYTLCCTRLHHPPRYARRASVEYESRPWDRVSRSAARRLLLDAARARTSVPVAAAIS